MHVLVENRQPCNADMANHQTIVCAPQVCDDGAPAGYLVGMLGVLNGLLDEGQAPIEAMYTNDGVLMGFRIRGDQTSQDFRQVAPSSLVPERAYQVQDRAGNNWLGTFVSPTEPLTQNGLHLRLSDGAIVFIDFNDVAGIIKGD